MSEPLELLVRREGGAVRLCSPEVGYVTEVAPAGRVLRAGERAGALIALGRARDLTVPQGVEGEVVSERPERVRHPVGYGDVVYELAPLAPTGAAREAAAAAGPKEGALALRAPQSGRFYHRPAPGEPAFAPPGAVVAEGQPVGLIEVMKTFTHVPYRAGTSLPPRARIVRWLVVDGGDVRQGEPLAELEPA
jgi:biotin carboxyl carrier protein